MTIVSHAQNFEDVLLWRAFRDVECGRYIDIGAHDPEIDSVSLAFYEAGWRGVHVEPIPHYAARLREARPDETVIEAAVTDAAGPIPFYELGGLSSGSRRVVEHHARAGHFPREILVPTVRLDGLLEALAPDVHWLKVDVEGMEAEVLRSWGDCPIRPWALVIESTFPNTEEPQQHLWNEQVTARDYREVFFDGLSRYFVHEEHFELAPLFAAPANVFDRFTVSPTHFSAAPMQAELHARNEQLAEQGKRTGQLAAELGEAEDFLLEARARIDHLEKEAVTARSATLRLESNREELRIEIARSEARTGVVERELAEARTAATRLENQRNSAKIELARLEQRSTGLQDKLDRADSSWREANARIKVLEDQLADSREIATRIEKERDGAVADRRSAEALARKIRSDLEAELDQLRSTMVQIRSLMAAALDEPVGISKRILQWLGFASTRTAREALRDRVESAVRESGGTQSSMNNFAPTTGRNPYVRANSLAELIAWNDVDFVRCAYVTILGRQPDRQGEDYYTARIQGGHSKLEILWQLRHSTEAQSHDPGIAGLDRALRVERARSWLPRAMRRLRHRPTAVATDESTETVDPSPSAPIGWQSLLPQTNAKRIDDLAREKEALAAELEVLKGVVEGLGHAVRGMANAQARHELQIERMPPAETPARRKASAPARN